MVSRMRRIILPVVTALAIVCHSPTCFTQQNQPASAEQKQVAADDGLKPEDKAELIKLSLERALVEKKIPDYNIIEKQETFLLSSENLTTDLVPQIKGYELVVLAPKQIQERAESRGDYVYYFRFRKFEVQGAKVRVSLDNIPMYAKKPSRLAFGGGFTVEYQKIEDKWVGEEVLNWIV